MGEGNTGIIIESFGFTLLCYIFLNSRKFMTDLMKSCANKMIYDAQRFIKALIQIMNIEDHSGNNIFFSVSF